jgi:hypothetical protein
MPAWLRWPIRLLQSVAGRSIDSSGHMLTRPLFEKEAGGFKLLNYSTTSTPTGSPVTSLHSDAAKEFMWTHTNEVINRILEK